MRIEQIDVEGFRSLKKLTWRPEGLNVLIGPNGSGKSNVLRLLQMLSCSANGSLGRYVQSQGGMESLVWDGVAPRVFVRIATPQVELGPECYELEMTRVGATFHVTHELLINSAGVRSKLRSVPFKFIERDTRHAVIFDEKQHGLKAIEDQVPEEETLLSVAGGPFARNKWLPAYQSEFSSITVYHDLHVNQDAAIRKPTVARYEKRVAPDGQNLIAVLHTLYTGDREFKKQVNYAMNAAFGDDFEELLFPPAADQRVQLRVRWKSLSREQPAADLSDGTLRFLLLLAILASPSPAPLIAIDEPETGLHPSMLPIVTEHAVDASHRSQVIFTTHSPQLLDAFHDSRPATTVVGWAEGQTVLRKLEGEKLDYWLTQYTLGKLFSTGELEDMQ